MASHRLLRLHTCLNFPGMDYRQKFWMMYETFARQMMHQDWFGQTQGVEKFKGDTLREYAGYFTEINYPAWNESDLFFSIPFSYSP